MVIGYDRVTEFVRNCNTVSTIKLTMECEVDDLGGTLDVSEAGEVAILRTLRKIVRGQLILIAEGDRYVVIDGACAVGEVVII